MAACLAAYTTGLSSRRGTQPPLPPPPLRLPPPPAAPCWRGGRFTFLPSTTTLSPSPGEYFELRGSHISFVVSWPLSSTTTAHLFISLPSSKRTSSSTCALLT